ncbi:MAG: hypothetical protein MR965_02050, partial [Lachnospiraceae bacterium]|nr:hypothetical protein [Lachnospiraceae bacterium]
LSVYFTLIMSIISQILLKTRKIALAELLFSASQKFCSLIRPKKQMPALLSLAFFLGSLYHKFATQGNLF